MLQIAEKGKNGLIGRGKIYPPVGRLQVKLR
jgi:hypothetical protein